MIDYPITDQPSPSLDTLVQAVTSMVEFADLFRLVSDDDPVRIVRVGDLHREALGPTRRKRPGHFAHAASRAVVDYLKARGLVPLTPCAAAALASVRESAVIDVPPGEHLDLYAMLRDDQHLALARQHNPVGRQLIRGELTPPYTDPDTSVVQVPMRRVQYAAALDADAACRWQFERWMSR